MLLFQFLYINTIQKTGEMRKIFRAYLVHDPRPPHGWKLKFIAQFQIPAFRDQEQQRSHSPPSFVPTSARLRKDTKIGFRNRYQRTEFTEHQK